VRGFLARYGIAPLHCAKGVATFRSTINPHAYVRVGSYWVEYEAFAATWATFVPSGVRVEVSSPRQVVALLGTLARYLRATYGDERVHRNTKIK
jgi:hypothetical protein